jgi:signal recognition particle receptor subunit beta
MLIQFSIANFSGNEIIRYEFSKFSEKVLDMDLVSNFLQAMQMFSENLGTSIKEIVFSNVFLYIQTYGDFTIRLMLDEKPNISLEKILNELAKKMYELVGDIGNDVSVFPKKVIEDNFLSILHPLTTLDSEIIESSGPDLQVPLQPSKPKIAIVGLEKAGKTSVKKAFFEKWSTDMIQKIRPTLGIETLNKKIDYIGQQFMVMDFGGQPTFRKKYLSNGMNWKGISILIFLIDIQKEETFEVAAEYLRNVWEITKKVNKIPPRISIFFHKFDPDRYFELTQAVGKCMGYLGDFLANSTVYTTSIENDSCISAMIKSIYFSSPEVVIRKLFDELILARFEEDLISKFESYEPDWNLDSEEVTKRLENVRIITRQMGKEYGFKLQEIWFEYFMGDWEPKEQLLKWNIMDIEKTKKELYIRIRNWVDPGTNLKPLILKIFDGLVQGIAITLQMAKPKRIEEEGFFGVWKFRL